MIESKANIGLILAYTKGYRVTDAGELISPTQEKLRPYILSKERVPYHYFSVKIIRGTRNSAKVKVAKLQAFQKYGYHMFEPGIVVRHKNNNSLDDSCVNILIGTLQQNCFDNPREDRLWHGLNAAKTLRKLTPERLTEFRTDRKDGMVYRELMEKYNIAKSTVSYIVNHKTYILD